MNAVAARIPISDLLPQRGELLLLSELLDWSAQHVEVHARVPENHPLTVPGQGMPSWVGIELMAQTVSVFSALELREQGLAPRIGLLLGTREYRAHEAFFPPGADLRVRAVLLLRDARELGVFGCTIHLGPRLLAQARVKGYVPERIEDFLGRDSDG